MSINPFNNNQQHEVRHTRHTQTTGGQAKNYASGSRSDGKVAQFEQDQSRLHEDHQYRKEVALKKLQERLARRLNET